MMTTSNTPGGLQMMTNSAVPRIIDALHSVMVQCGEAGLAKDSRNAAQNYNFRSITDVLALINRTFAACGVIMTVTTEGLEGGRVPGRPPSEKDRGTSDSFEYIFHLRFKFYSIHDGSSIESDAYVPIRCSDPSKAYGLATSYGLKEYLLKSLAIPVEGIDDPDFDDVKTGTIGVAKETAATKRKARTPKAAAPTPRPVPVETTPPEAGGNDEDTPTPSPGQDPNLLLRAERLRELTLRATSQQLSPRGYVLPTTDFIKGLGLSYLSELDETQFGQLKLFLDAKAKVDFEEVWGSKGLEGVSTDLEI